MAEISWKDKAIQQQINKQIRFSGWQTFNQDQHSNLKIKIGSILYNKVIEADGIPRPLLEIFSQDDLVQIENIFQKIRETIPTPNEIQFGCTFVTVYKNCRQNEEIILFRCTLPPNKNIFMEPNGRTYDSWADFLKSNKIQNGCQYFAPRDGIYAADGPIEEFEKQNISKYFDVAFIVAGLVCIVATVEIPVISTVFSVFMYLYGAFRSASTIIDRYRHKESVNNAEILTLLTICLTQLCIAMVSYKEYFFKEFGIRWCKLAFSTINGTVLFLDFMAFAMSFSILCSNAKAAKFSTSDLFNLLLQAFLLYEQAINTIEFLELLSDTSYFRSFQKMTKTQKRNWKRRKSKEFKRNVANKKIFEYKNDFFRWMKWLGNQILSRSGEFLMKNLVNTIMAGAGTIFAGFISIWRPWQQNRL